MRHGLTRSVLQRIVTNKDSLLEMQENPTVSTSRKRQREATFADVDEALLIWFKHARDMNVPLSGPIVKAKAEKLAADLSHNGWNCSDGWLSRWKQRHNISYKVSFIMLLKCTYCMPTNEFV